MSILVTPKPLFINPVFREENGIIYFRRFPGYYREEVFIDLSNIVGTSAVTLYELPFDFSIVSPLSLVTVPALATIINTRLHIETPFDVPATIEIGDATDPARLMPSAQNNPLELGVYETTPDYEYGALAGLTLTISAPGATQGAGRILIQYEP